MHLIQQLGMVDNVFDLSTHILFALRERLRSPQRAATGQAWVAGAVEDWGGVRVAQEAWA